VAIGRFIGHLFSGRLPELDPVLTALDDAAKRRDEDPFRGVWSFLVGRSALAQGRLADAVPALREGAALLRLRDPGMMLPWCLAALIQALCAADDGASARATLAELETVRFDVTRNIEVEVELARAWASAVMGNRSEGRELALATARTHHADGRAALAALAYHDALRLGVSPATVAGPLDELTGAAEGPVVAAMALHARALAHGDRAELERAALGFEDAGMMLHAAEAMTGAAQLALDAGSRAAASDLRVQAATLAACCGPALTPMLEPISDRDALAALTRKEQEVALMAARGMTKREIADSLCVSVRTVGNHINHLYAKLCVTTRDELRAVLHVEADAPSG
jgi:DNA-binding CsgD family transcriptional regulator